MLRNVFKKRCFCTFLSCIETQPATFISSVKDKWENSNERHSSGHNFKFNVFAAICTHSTEDPCNAAMSKSSMRKQTDEKGTSV